MVKMYRKDGQIWLDDDGQIVKCDKFSSRDQILLPVNSTGRTMVTGSTVPQWPKVLELKEAPKTWIDFMTTEERATYDAIKKACESRMPKRENLTPLEKAKRQLERAQAKLAKLMGE